METQTNDQQAPTRNLFTVKQMAQKYPVFTEAALRNLIFKANPIVLSRSTIPGNGFDAVIVRIGRKVIIDEAKFMQWLGRHSAKGYMK